MVCALVFLAAFWLYLRTLCPTVSSGDTGELLSAAILLDVTHPPGYGMQTLAARLAMEMPVGGLLFRGTLICALAGAGLCVSIFLAGRRLCSHPMPALLAASLLAVAPYVWWQATMLEKYALQLLLAGAFLTAALAGKRMVAAFLFSLALTHHVQALFLLPAFAWLGPAREWREGRRILLAAFIFLVPLSLKAMYPALRAYSIGQREAALIGPLSPPYINWGEPDDLSSLFDYLRLKYYSATLTRPGKLLRSSPPRHLAHYPRQLTWPGLLLALAGLGFLARGRTRDAVVLGAIAVIALFFALYFPLPPSLSVSYHQNAFLALSLAVPAAFAALGFRWRSGPGLAAALCLPLVLLLALSRAKVHDASRHWLVHDFNASAMRLAPLGAVMLGGFEYDLFAPATLGRALGLRPDLRPLPAPRKLASGEFTLRASYGRLARARLPGAIRNFSDSDPAPQVLRRLLLDNRSRYCFTMNGLAAPLASQELFAARALLLAARSPACGTADDRRPWRAVSSRSWFSPERSLLPHRTALELTADCLRRSAAQLPAGDAAGRESLLRIRTRILPGDASAWLSLGLHYQSSGNLPRAFTSTKKALELDPDSCGGHALLLSLELLSGNPTQAREHALDLLRRPPFRNAPSAAPAIKAIGAGPLEDALPLILRTLAQTAYTAALELPANPEMEMRRLYLLHLAAELAPDWPAVQLTLARALLAGASQAQAAVYLRRYLKIAPAGPERDTAAALLGDG